ncbi:unnamed protein product [Adineta steineri]|uniref:Uncharacterized protein n=1 Tax=Adineta steineri TaxID=433720 RepID=A0A815UKI3_9BILA|nr:unnamed protein product [Adineta steineri]CAF1520702.1 unnamed protein product [Adineta steineri]CAF3685950.1 unnamed protein product [Adineta steineri]CAF3704055.1 unnamed protein product [Adineta steineri]
MKIIDQNVCLAVLLVLMTTGCIIRGKEKGVNQAAKSNSVADYLINNGDANDTLTPVDDVIRATTPRPGRLYRFTNFLHNHGLIVFLILCITIALILAAVIGGFHCYDPVPGSDNNAN